MYEYLNVKYGHVAELLKRLIYGNTENISARKICIFETLR